MLSLCAWYQAHSGTAPIGRAYPPNTELQTPNQAPYNGAPRAQSERTLPQWEGSGPAQPAHSTHLLDALVQSDVEAPKDTTWRQGERQHGEVQSDTTRLSGRSEVPREAARRGPGRQHVEVPGSGPVRNEALVQSLEEAQGDGPPSPSTSTPSQTSPAGPVRPGPQARPSRPQAPSLPTGAHVVKGACGQMHMCSHSATRPHGRTSGSPPPPP